MLQKSSFIEVFSIGNGIRITVKSENIWALLGNRTCDESHDYEPLFVKA